MPTFWELLKPEDRVKLANYQWKHFGLKLDVTLPPRKPVTFSPNIKLDEVEKEMKKPPGHQRRVT